MEADSGAVRQQVRQLAWAAAFMRRAQDRRAARAAQPFPTAFRRARSMVGLVLVVGMLGVLTAALVGAFLVAIALMASHLVG